MSLKDEMIAGIEQAIDLGGEDVVYNGSTITGMFDSVPREVETVDGSVIAYDASVEIKKSDVSAPAEGDEVSAGSIDYTVASVMGDEYGTWTLALVIA